MIVLQAMKVSEILKSLAPKNQEELSLLRVVLSCAEKLHKGPHMDLGLGPAYRSGGFLEEQPGIHFDAQTFLQSIPEDSKKYLHGLVEALDIYQSIYGHPLHIQNITISDKSVRALKQIRDMCLEEGVRSLY